MKKPVVIERRVPLSGLIVNAAVGPESGPPLVFLHGVTRRWDDWLVLFPYLAGRWQVHALDQRGHGQSGRVPHAYRVIDFVVDAADYVATLDEPVVIVGHSLGAMAACGVAARLPERVRALVLEDPTFEMTGRRIAETAFPDTFAAYLPHVGSDRPAGVAARELAQAAVRLPGGDARVPLGSIRDLASLRYTASCLRQLDPTVLPLVLEGCWLEDYDVARTLARIACPTLFLQADPETGGALPDHYACELVRQIADGLHVKLPGTSHNIHSTQPEALLRPLLPFLASLDPRG